MPEVLPFRGLHYAETDLSALICPPYDVISPEEQQELCRRSPLNVVRLECGESRPDDGPSENRYTRAAAALRDWLERGVLVRDQSESFYAHNQRFEHEGQRVTRLGLLARVRLHEWNEGPIRPHEHTLSKPKEDRLDLLRATRLNISPIMALYRDDDARVRGAIEGAGRDARPLATARSDGEKHNVSRVDGGATGLLVGVFRDKTLYVVDGHHRYETALAYLKERRSRARSWTGDEPENFVLMTLIAREDPGLLELPTHRLLKGVSVPDDLGARLERCFAVEDVSDVARGWPELRSLLAAKSEERAAFALATKDGRRLIAQVRDAASIADDMPADAPASWRSLDAAVLQEVVLRGILGVEQQSAADGSLAFTHDGEEALRLVEARAYSLAFLLRPTPVDRVLALAGAGERMPQKSTYFHPKLPAGLVMNPLD
ncbi:MAG: DUF1015 domain-containing protein [Dehalococcoidia bacterium]